MSEAGRKRRAAIVDFLRTFATEHSYPPSFQEIRIGCGLRSTSGVGLHLRVLAKEGIGRHWLGRARTTILGDTVGQERANG